MLTGELTYQAIPSLKLSDKVYQAMQLMTDNQTVHLAVIDADDKYLGLVSEEMLLSVANEDDTLQSLQHALLPASVKADEFFFKALQLVVDHDLSIAPIIDQEHYLLGVVTHIDLLRQLADFNGINQPGGVIVLEVESLQYSFSEISKIVEQNDAQITQLNSTTQSDTGLMQITIRLNKMEISDIVASFQRYEYTIKYYFGEEIYENELKSNYDNLMNYLSI